MIKTHKINYPIRPTVSFIGSPTYQISNFLPKILTPFANLASQKLKNPYILKEILTQKSINDDEIMVSFDVKALFTSIPFDLAKDSVKAILDENPTLLPQLTSLTSDDILSLLDVCFQAAVFKHNDTIYKQKQGTPMVSNVSVVLAELTMQKLEKTMFEEAPYQPILWKRYLDDIFAILPTNQVDTHLSYLNSLNAYINFTIEKKTRFKIALLRSSNSSKFILALLLFHLQERYSH